MLQKLKSLCQERGYQLFEVAGDKYCVIATPYDYWKVNLPSDPSVGYKVYHKAKFDLNKEYHLQFRCTLPAESLVTYIQEHTESKYHHAMFPFTVFEEKFFQKIPNKNSVRTY